MGNTKRQILSHKATNLCLLALQNKIGLVGLLFAILTLLLSSVHMIGQVFGLMGLVFSIAGVFGKPKVFAIIGLVLSSYSIVKLIYFLLFIQSLLTATNNL